MIKVIEVSKQMKKSGNGNIFPVYSAKMKDGKFIQMKFTKDCCNQAIVNGFKIPDSENDVNRFTITTDSTNINISKNGLYDVAWVRAVDSVGEIVRKNVAEDLF